MWQYINIFICLIIYCLSLSPGCKVYKGKGLFCFHIIVFLALRSGMWFVFKKYLLNEQKNDGKH